METKHTPGPWRAADHPNTHGRYAIEPTIGCAYGEHEEARCNARLISAAPALLHELKAAHTIIRNALNLMTSEQKLQWAEMNADLVEFGTTRAHERESVIKQAEGDKTRVTR